MKKPVAFLILVIAFSLAAPIYAKKRKRSKKLRKAKPARWGTVVGTGIPHPVDVGVGLIQPNGTSHLVTGGMFELPLGSKGRVKNLSASLNHIEYKYRREPWRRHPFYWEIGFGIQQIGITGSQVVDLSNDQTSVKVDVAADISIYSLYASPHVGFIWFRRSGFFNGFGFGYQIPFYSSASIDSRFSDDEFIDDSVKSTASYQLVEEDFEELGKKAGKLGFPYFQLIQLGYLF